MPRTTLITFILLSLTLAVTACSKKPQNMEPNSVATVTDSVIQNNESPLGNMSPFIFTVDTAHQCCNEKVGEAEGGDSQCWTPNGGAEMDWCQREIELEEFQMSFWINKSNENDRVLYDLDCDGDGIYEITGDNQLDFSCTYPKDSGKHQIRLRGEIPGVVLCLESAIEKAQTGDFIYAYRGEDDDDAITYEDQGNYFASWEHHYVISIDDWGSIQWKTMDHFAAECDHLTKLPDYPPDLTHVTDLSYMFTYTSVNSPINNWDVSNITNMHMMFHGASDFNQPLDKWDVSNVKDMSQMFENATSFNQPLDTWNVKNVENMLWMFEYSGVSDYPE